MKPDRRAELLEKATLWVLAHGLIGLSLRPLAAGIGTSARMLVYHFGSKEQLVAGLLEEVAARWMQALRNELDADVPLDRALERLWNQTLRAPESRDIHVLSLEAWALGLSSGNPAYRPFLDAVAGGWVELIEAWLTAQPDGTPTARTRATLIVAAIEGLLLHRLTDEALPVDAAFAELMGWLRGQTSG